MTMTELGLFIGGMAVVLLAWAFIRIGEEVELERDRRVVHERLGRKFHA